MWGEKRSYLAKEINSKSKPTFFQHEMNTLIQAFQLMPFNFQEPVQDLHIFLAAPAICSLLPSFMSFFTQDISVGLSLVTSVISFGQLLFRTLSPCINFVSVYLLCLLFFHRCPLPLFSSSFGLFLLCCLCCPMPIISIGISVVHGSLELILHRACTFFDHNSLFLYVLQSIIK